MSSDAEAERSQAVGFIMLMLVNSLYWAEGKHEAEDFQIRWGQLGLVATGHDTRTRQATRHLLPSLLPFSSRGPLSGNALRLLLLPFLLPP